MATLIDPDSRCAMHWLVDGSITMKAVHGASASIKHVAASVWDYTCAAMEDMAKGDCANQVVRKG